MNEAQCYTCGAVYARWDALYVHWDALHNPNSKFRPRMLCRFCGRSYRYGANLIKHQARMHPPAPLDETLRAAREAMA